MASTLPPYHDGWLGAGANCQEGQACQIMLTDVRASLHSAYSGDTRLPRVIGTDLIAERLAVFFGQRGKIPLNVVRCAPFYVLFFGTQALILSHIQLRLAREPVWRQIVNADLVHLE